MKDCYKVHCGRLQNGLRFYSQNDSSESKELALIVIMAGSIHDPPNRRGLSHLTEHVICAESKQHNPQQVESIMHRTIGYSDLAWITTGRTATTFGPMDSIKKSHNRNLFNMFSCMIKEPVISKSVCDSEKASVNQEHFLMARDSMVDWIEDLFCELLFPKRFTARNPIDGRMSDVRRSSLLDINRHIQRYYVPKNAFVVYLGPSHSEVARLIERELGDWVNQPRHYNPSFRTRYNADSYVLKKPKRKVVVRPGIHQYHVAIGFPTETYLSKDAEAIDILARILSRRMYGEIRTKNQSWSGGSYRSPVLTERTFAHGLFCFHFATIDQSFVRVGIRAFRDQCRLLCDQLVSRSEAEDCIGFMYDSEFMEVFKRCPSLLMDEIVASVSNGDLDLTRLHERGERINKYLRRGGRAKLREVAQKYLSQNSACVVIKPS